MSKCFFVCTYPEYLLDRTIVINGKHEHKISGYKLAKASDYFKTYLLDVRSREIEKSRQREEQEQRRSGRRARTRSVSEIDTDSVEVNYENLEAFEFALSFIHTSDEDKQTLLSLGDGLIGEVLKVAEKFQMKQLSDYCFSKVKDRISLDNCWRLWQVVSETSNAFSEIESFCKIYVLDNFAAAAAQREQLHSLTKEQLKNFLMDDRLNCRSEMILFEVINSWIDHCPTSRAVHCRQLLECLRLGRMTHDDLNAICGNQYVTADWEECQRLIVWARLSIEEVNSQTSPSTRSGDAMELLDYIRKPRLPREAIFVVGGWEGNQDEPNFGPSPVLQIYDCRANQWMRFTDEPIALDEGHAYSGCILINGKLYVVGGYTSHGPTQTLKMFDCASRVWRYMAPMHEKRNYVCVARLGEFLYALGGHNGKIRLNSVERYDVNTNSWSFICPMRQTRSDAGADSLLGRVYVCGGFDGHQFFNSVEMYNPGVDQWTTVANMLSIRSGVSAVATGGYLYALGGNNGQHRLNTVERYHPESNSWCTVTPMQRQRSNFCVTVLDGDIYVMGGWSDESQSTIALVERCDLSDISNMKWSYTKELHLPASANSCCAVKGLANIREYLAPR